MANLSNINGKFVVEQTTGYVGVGTTDPEYLLHINSSDIPNGTRLTIENTNGSGKKYGLISDNTGVFTVRDLTASSDRFAISNLGNATFTGDVTANGNVTIANSSPDLYLFPTGNFHSFRVSAQENVANTFEITPSTTAGGSTYSNPALSISHTGNSTFAGSVTSNFQATTSSGSININSSDPTIRFNRVGGTTDKSIYELRAIAVGGTNDYFQLRKWNDAQTVASELMKIDNSGNTTFTGNVLIGTNINSSIGLQVNQSLGSGNAIGFFRNSASSDGNGLVVDVTNTPSNYLADFRIGNSSKVRIDTEGNVGIGTDDPDAKLHIYGSASLSEMYLGEDAAADKAGILKYTQGNGTGTGVITLSHWGNTSITQSLAIKYGGNVGIGTDSPAQKLHLEQPGATSVYTQWSNNSRAINAYVGLSAAGQLLIQNNTSIKFSTGASYTDNMLIDSSGFTTITHSGAGASLTLGQSGNISINENIGYLNFYSNDSSTTSTGGVGGIGVYGETAFSTSYTPTYMSFFTHDTTANDGTVQGNVTERMRITSAGGISFGSTGTAYGTSGQVLTSNGNAAPTWQAAGGGTVTWPNVGAGIRTDYILGFKPPGSGYAGFYFQTAAGGHAGYLLIRGTSNAGQIYKAEGITLVSDSSWVTIASRTTTNAGVRLMSGATSAERLVIQDNGHSYFQGNLGIGTSSTSFSSDYDNLIVGSGSGNNGIGIYSSSTGNSTLAFLPTTGSQSDFEIRVEHDYPFGNMEVYFQHSSDYYLRMFERNNGQDPIIKVGHNNIPVGINSGDDATMQFRPDSNNWYPAIAINAEDSQGNSRGFIEMKSNRSNTFQADYFLKFFNYNGNEIGSIRVNNNNNNVAYNTSSDYRLKEDLKEFKALDTISKIKVYNYKWKNDSSGFRDQGILAHELDELIPQAVSGEKDATDEDNNILPQSVDYSKIVPHLVQSIQELKAEIEILKNK